MKHSWFQAVCDITHARELISRWGLDVCILKLSYNTFTRQLGIHNGSDSKIGDPLIGGSCGLPSESGPIKLT